MNEELEFFDYPLQTLDWTEGYHRIMSLRYLVYKDLTRISHKNGRKGLRIQSFESIVKFVSGAEYG